MSTKIHHGWRAEGDVNALDVAEHAAELLLPLRRRADARTLAESAAERFDNAVCNGTAPSAAPAFDAYKEFTKEQSELDPNLRLHDPNRFELRVRRDPDTGDLAILVDTENADFLDAFAAVDGVYRYPYWNNTDRPDGVTSSEWDERRDFWDRVLSYRFPRAALTYRLHPKPEGFMADLVCHPRWGASPEGIDPLVVEAIPVRTERAVRLATIALADVALQDPAMPRGEVWGLFFQPTPHQVVRAASRLVLPLDADALAAGRDVPEWMDEARMQLREAARAAWAEHRANPANRPGR